MRKFLALLAVFFLLTACKSPPHQSAEEPPPPETIAAEPDIEPVQAPQFTITSITIVQADLINTRLKLSLKIDNPNAVPITLSSFRYEFYGNDRFWTSGTEKNLPVIPAQSSSEASFEFEMNFINMKRQLLDDIIALRQVRYRIVGDVDVETGVPRIPGLRINFDYSGNSTVIK
ncbi:MAG: LEA type 2 family protein [Treponema sp.]|jgi:LEA14-like dessication related protein|nr:LEA type 2 family protein [Treponema sp.]